MTTDLHSVAAPAAARRTTEPRALSTGTLLGRVVAAEWVKARSLASTWAALGTLCFVPPAIGAVVCATQARADVTGPTFDPMRQVYAGLALRERRGQQRYERGVLGVAAVLVLTALLGLGVGALLRSSAAATIGLTAGLFLLPVLVMLLPTTVRTSVAPWTPGQAGAAVLVLAPRAEHLSPLAGLLLFVGWASLAMVLAAVALLRRDA